MNEQRIRVKLLKKIESTGLSLRDIQELTGVAYSTIGRFKNGQAMTVKNLSRVDAWLEGKEIEKPKPISVRRFKVGDKVFLITVEQLISPKE